jgi:hypothetical protein
MSQSNLNLAAKSTGPVECFGQKFPSEEARRGNGSEMTNGIFGFTNFGKAGNDGHAPSIPD